MRKSARLASMSHTIFAPKSREEIAKFPEIRRAARTKIACIRLANDAHAKPNIAEVVRVEKAFRSEKARVRRRDHAYVAPKSRKRIAKFRKIFGAPRAQKVACTQPLRAVTRMTSSNLFNKSCLRFNSNKCAFGVEITQTLR